MFILLKLDYAKFGVFNLFFSKVIEENRWGWLDPPFGKGRVKIHVHMVAFDRQVERGIKLIANDVQKNPCT